MRAIAFAAMTQFYILNAGSLAEARTVVTAAALIDVYLGMKS